MGELTNLIVAGVIFAVSLALIFTEKMHRTTAAIVGAAAMVTAGKILGFMDETDAIVAIDFHTLGLLLGMMTLVALIEPTGFFQYVAVWVGRLSGGRPIWMLIMLGSVTTVLSMFLDNVTTIVLIVPVTILMSEIIGLSPVPFLISEAILSNTGGVATLVGDPPNMLIASASGFTFMDFLTHSLPVILFAWIIALLLLLFLFRKDLAVQPGNTGVLDELNPDETLNDRPTAIRTLIVLGVAIVLFFIHDRLGLTTDHIALGSAAVAMLWTQPKVDDLFKRIEWSVLFFFIALFVMVAGLEAAGFFELLVNLLENFHSIPLMWFGVILIWFVAFCSAIVDNIPITIALIPVILGLGETGIDIRPLWWALAFGAGLGGNGTILGSSANIVVANMSERTRTPITAARWSKIGLPLMVVTSLVVTVLYIIAFPLFVQ